MTNRGLSLSVKMILSSTVLIVLVIVGFGALSIRSTRSFYEELAAEQSKQFANSLRSKGISVTTTLAQALEVPLSDSLWTKMRSLANRVLEEDDELRLIYVLNSRQGVVAHSDTGRYPVGDAHPAIEDESWAAIVNVWKERAALGEGDPLVESLDLTSEQDGRLLYFAYPVTLNEVHPTAALALAEELEGQTLVGYLVLGYTTEPIKRYEKAAALKMDNATYKSFLKTGFFGGLFMLLGTGVAVFQGIRISRPLKILAWRADEIANGNLDVRVEVSSNDEIGLLGQHFNHMADRLNVLLEENVQKATLEKELEVARNIQETLVPSDEQVNLPFLRFCGYFEPASKCGGDWWTHHQLVGDKQLIVIGDVTGHGVPSAMITATAKAAVDAAREFNGDDVSVSQLLAIMNSTILASAKRKFVMTCFASIIDPETRTITFANAGHNFPYLYRSKDGNGRGMFRALAVSGNRLGDDADSKFDARTLELEEGDTIVWYTDGLVECEGPSGEAFGEKRFRASIRRAASHEPAHIRDQIMADAAEVFGEMPHKDDITFVVGKVV